MENEAGKIAIGYVLFYEFTIGFAAEQPIENTQ